MVEIRRPRQATAAHLHHRTTTSATSFLTCRNIILLIVLGQLLFMIASLLQSSSSSPPTITTFNVVVNQQQEEAVRKKQLQQQNQRPSGGGGLHGALEEWRNQRKGKRAAATTTGQSQQHHKQQQQGPNTNTENDSQHEHEEEQNPQETPVEEDEEEEGHNNNHNAEDEEDASGGETSRRRKEGEVDQDGNYVNHEEVEESDQNDAAAVNSHSTTGKSQAVHSKGDSSMNKQHGSGPTPLGYLADYQYERENPPFRHVKFPQDNTELEETVAFMIRDKTNSVRSCRYIEHGKILTRAKCREADTTLLLYNTAKFTRTWCSLEIEPKTLKRMDEPCKEPIRLLPVDMVPIDGVDMPPIVVASHSNSGALDPEFVPCDIPCQAESVLQGTARYIVGTDWKIIQTWDDPFTNPDARVERTDYRKDVYYSTTSFKSSIPLSFFSFDKYDLKNTQAVDYDTVENKASYLINDNCVAVGSRRHKWFNSMKANYHVAALGACHHDTSLPNGESLKTLEGRINIMKKYRFNMAFDQMTEKDHISPMIWESLMSGSLPILIGAQNMRDHLPAKSFIFGGDFSLWDLMSKHVVNVASNKTLWESYHAWRKDRTLLEEFEVKYNFTKTSPTCRMCRWAYARRYGLGWDHAQQVIKETKLSRKLCVDSHNGLAFSPFQESWLTGRTSTTNMDRSKAVRPAATSTCPEINNDEEHTIDVSDDVKVHRSLLPHDGITDMIIHSIEIKNQEQGDLLLLLEFDVRNSEGAYFPNTHRLVPTQLGPLVSSISIQDDVSKVTILANWDTRITSPAEGVIEILIQENGESDDPDHERRLRIITEDVNVLHDKMTEFFPSPFCKMMTKDFVDPLEMFYVETS